MFTFCILCITAVFASERIFKERSNWRILIASPSNSTFFIIYSRFSINCGCIWLSEPKTHACIKESKKFLAFSSSIRRDSSASYQNSYFGDIIDLDRGFRFRFAKPNNYSTIAYTMEIYGVISSIWALHIFLPFWIKPHN